LHLHVWPLGTTNMGWEGRIGVEVGVNTGNLEGEEFPEAVHDGGIVGGSGHDGGPKRKASPQEESWPGGELNCADYVNRSALIIHDEDLVAFFDIDEMGAVIHVEGDS
jgi:hypothetical protein